MTKKDKQILLIGGLILVFLLLFKRKSTDPSAKNASSLAREIRLAFDPLNLGWVSWNGTNTEALYVIAAQVTDWGEVRQAYKTLYKSDLNTDLENELSASELNRFYDILNRR